MSDSRQGEKRCDGSVCFFCMTPTPWAEASLTAKCAMKGQGKSSCRMSPTGKEVNTLTVSSVYLSWYHQHCHHYHTWSVPCEILPAHASESLWNCLINEDNSPQEWLI